MWPVGRGRRRWPSADAVGELILRLLRGGRLRDPGRVAAPAPVRRGRGRRAGRDRRLRTAGAARPTPRAMLEAVLRSLLPLARQPRHRDRSAEAEALLAAAASRRRHRPRAPGAVAVADGRLAAEGMTVLDVDRVRSHFAFPDLGRVVTNNAASTQPPRELLAAARGADATATTTSIAGSPPRRGGRPTLFESAYDTFAQWLNAPSRRSIATYRNTTEAINAVMYMLLTRVPRRRQRGHHDDGAQLQLRAVVRDVPRDPAARSGAAWSAAWPASTTGPGARPRAPRRAGRRADQARLRHRRVELPRHQATAARRPRHRGPQRLRPRRRADRVAPAGRRGPARAQQLRRRAAAGRGLPGLLVPQDAGAVRRRGAVREGAPAGGWPAVPVRRRHDRRGPGEHRTASSTTTCRGSTAPARRTSSGSSPRRGRCGCWSTWSARRARRAGSTTTRRCRDRWSPRRCTAWRRTPGR